MTKKALAERNARWLAAARSALAEPRIADFDAVMMIAYRVGECTYTQAEDLYRQLNPLLPHEVDALVEYARTHKPGWKAKLAADWLEARTSGTLQVLRNSPRFGPGGLASFMLPRPVSSGS